MKKFFFVYLHSYTWQTFSVHALELFLFTSHGLYTNPIYVQRFFSFFPTHTYGSYKSFFIYTRCSHTQEFLSTHHLHTKIFYTHFLLHTCINKNLFLFFMNMTFIHNASFFLLGFLVHFIFRTTFLNEKLYTVPEFQQTLLTTTKQVPT